MPIRLRPDREQFDELRLIAMQGPTKLRKLQDCLDRIQPTPVSPSDLFAASNEILGDDSESVIRQLISINGIQRRTTVDFEEVFAALTKAIKEKFYDREAIIESWDQSKEAIRSLAESKSIRIVRQSIDLSYDYANLLRGFRVLTDIRPLFSNDAKNIEAAVISHTLRLSYDNAGSEQEVSIAIDEKDIETIVEQCKRALEKASSASNLLDLSATRSIITGRDYDS